MQAGKHILVIRFSAMGDVAMTVPVIKNALQQNPNLEITFVSTASFQPLFYKIERCNFYPVFLKTKHKGIGGLYSLFKELHTKYKFDAIIDLHNVLRSNIVSSLFKLNRCPVFKIDKGRAEKKLLTQKKNKVLKQLISTHQRYANVFNAAGINVALHILQVEPNLLPQKIISIVSPTKKLVGIAPYAQHKEKMYPLEKMKLVVQMLAKNNDVQILLFGGGNNEIEILKQWKMEIPNTICIAGNYSFVEELSIISNLALMVSMDSANMHLASLYNVPVVSIWGATHPYAGFYGWQQNENNIVQQNLSCRPCSVFGNKPCYRHDNACMKMIEPTSIIDKIFAVLSS